MIDQEVNDEPVGEVTPIVPISKIDTLIRPFVQLPHQIRWYADKCIDVRDGPLTRMEKQAFFTRFLQERLN